MQSIKLKFKIRILNKDFKEKKKGLNTIRCDKHVNDA